MTPFRLNISENFLHSSATSFLTISGTSLINSCMSFFTAFIACLVNRPSQFIICQRSRGYLSSFNRAVPTVCFEYSDKKASAWLDITAFSFNFVLTLHSIWHFGGIISSCSSVLPCLPSIFIAQLS